MANIYRNIASAAKDTGGLWDRLDEQMSKKSPPPAAQGMGIWGMVVAEATSGVWDHADTETIFLRRGQLDQQKLDVWHEASEETLILTKEGLLPIWDAALAKTDSEKFGHLNREVNVKFQRFAGQEHNIVFINFIRENVFGGVAILPARTCGV